MELLEVAELVQRMATLDAIVASNGVLDLNLGQLSLFHAVLS
jgi:hypothetical protein